MNKLEARKVRDELGLKAIDIARDLNAIVGTSYTKTSAWSWFNVIKGGSLEKEKPPLTVQIYLRLLQRFKRQ